MTEPVFSGELALYEALDQDAITPLRLARLKTGPVVLARIYANGLPVAQHGAAFQAACEKMKQPKGGGLLAVVQHQMQPHPVVAHALFNGVPLGSVLDKTRLEGMPVAADLSLLIADKICDAIIHLPAGLSHALLTTYSVLLSHEGEVAVLDVPLSAALGGQTITPEMVGSERAARLHKSVLAGKPGPRAVIWQIGAILLELISGEPFTTGGDIASRITQLCDAQEIPADIRDVMERALVENQDAFRSVAEMKETIGALIYQGAYAPSTFNLAFFMHSLYRGEEEAFVARTKALAAAALEFPAPAPEKPAPVAPAASKKTAPPKPPPAVPSFGGIAGGGDALSVEPAAGGKPVGLIVGAVLVIGLVAGAAFMLTRGKSKTPSPEETALQQAQAKIKELEAEKQKIADEFKKQQDELKANEEAQQKALLDAKSSEEKKRAEDELARLDAKRKALEAKRQAETEVLNQKSIEAEKPAAKPAESAKLEPPPVAKPVTVTPSAPSAPANPVPVAPPVSSPPAPVVIAADPVPAPAEPVKEIYSSAEVDTPATLRNDVKPEYPPRGRGASTVIVRLTVDTSGNVVGAELAKADPSVMGFNEAALAAAKKMRFAPAILNGKPVKSTINKTFKFGG